MNINKSKIMVFRNFGPLNKFLKWCYDNRIRFEVVPHFKYLGIHSFIKISVVSSTEKHYLAKQAKEWGLLKVCI